MSPHAPVPPSTPETHPMSHVLRAAVVAGLLTTPAALAHDVTLDVDATNERPVTSLRRGPGSSAPAPGSTYAGTLDVGLTNGDFSGGLVGWTVGESGGGFAPGSVDVVGGAAELLEGDSFVVSLSQTFVLPDGIATLSFDVSQVPGFDLTDDFLPDAFEATLLTDGGFPAVDPWAPFATSFFNLQEDGASNLGPTTTFDGTRVHVALDAVPAGVTLTLVFDLIGADADVGSGLQVDAVGLDFDCDVPASWSYYGDAFPGGNGAPVLTPLSSRAIGATYEIEISNPTGVEADAIGFIGLAPAATPTGFGGLLLLEPVTIISFDLPAAGMIAPHDNDPDIALCGLPVYAQVVMVDPTAPQGWAFSEGLEIIIGSP